MEGPDGVDTVRARVGRWRSERAKQRFHDMEDMLWREAAGDVTALDVDTSFGLTRAYRWPGTGTPVVFLHGGGMTSVSWAPYAHCMVGRDVYAIDIMGDAGRSEPRVIRGSKRRVLGARSVIGRRRNGSDGVSGAGGQRLRSWAALEGAAEVRGKD